MMKNLPGWLRFVLKELFRLAVYFGGSWWILKDQLPLYKILLLSAFLSWGFPLLERLMRKTASRFGPAAKIWYYSAITLIAILLVYLISNGGF